MNIAFIGMSGSGKTTVAKLFESFGKKVYDTDEIIVNEHGNITEIFRKSGEDYFRRLETEAVKRLCAIDGVVIATGGGCVLREENVKLLKSCGKIVYLRAAPKTLIERLRGDNARPLLSGDLEERILKLYGERADIYERAADIIIDTDGLTPAQTIQRITREIL